MLPSRADRARSVDRRTRTTAALTVVAFAAAAAARFLVAGVDAGLVAGAPSRYATAAAGSSFDTVNVVAGIGASAAGLGVLLFGATLVLAVRHHRDQRLSLALAAVTVLLAAGAVAAAVVAVSATDFTTVADASLLRTALAGLAVASLPAVVLAALRARAAR